MGEAPWVHVVCGLLSLVLKQWLLLPIGGLIVGLLGRAVAAEWTPFEMCERRGVDGVVHLRLFGELDLAVADQLSTRFRQLKRAGCRVRLDLSQLRFIDRCGLLAVLCAVSDARGGGWVLVVDREVSTSVRRLIELVGVSSELWPSDDRSRVAARGPIAEALLERTSRLLRARRSE